MTTAAKLDHANKLFRQAVINGRADTIQTIAAAIWWLVSQQVSAELAGEI